MKWITRERPKIDRLACPWLIKKFIDFEAEFLFVPENEVLAKSYELNAIPFDIPNVEYSHYDDKVTFDYFIKKHKLQDKGLDKLALIVGQLIRINIIYQMRLLDYGLFLGAYVIILKTIMIY